MNDACRPTGESAHRAIGRAVSRLAAACALVVLSVAVPVFSGARLEGAAWARPYSPSGSAIAGGASTGAARPITPGQYLDSLDSPPDSTSDSPAKYYAFALPVGVTPYFTATVSPPDDALDTDTLQINVTMTPTSDNGTCQAEGSETSTLGDNRLGPITAVLVPDVAKNDACLVGGNVVVKVTRSGTAGIDRSLPVELTLSLEPPARAAGLPGPAASKPGALAAVFTGVPAKITSGNSYSSAPLLGDGIYSDSLQPGDTRFVRVHLDWGQRFAYDFSAAAVSGVTGDFGFSGEAVVDSPVRAQVAQQTDANRVVTGVGAEDVSMRGSTLVPVRYRNRESSDSDIAMYDIEGDYYLVLQAAEPKAGSSDLAVPYALKIQVYGTAGRGPVYGATSTDSTSGASSERSKSASGADTRNSRVLVIASVIGGVAVLVGLVGLVGLVVLRRRGAGRRSQ